MLTCFDHYATATKALIDPLSTIPIRANTINLVLTKKAAKLLDGLLWAKWWAYFAHGVEHAAHTFFVRNRQRETVTCAARWVGKCRVQEAPVIRPLTNARVNARLNTFRGDEGLYVAPKLRAVLGLSPNRVLLIFLVNELL